MGPRRTPVRSPCHYSPAVPPADVRPLVYGVLDVVLFALYAYFFAAVIPSSSGWVTAVQVAIAAAALVAGVGTLSRRPIGWRAAVAGCTTLLALAALLLLLTVMSGAFLAGVYGAYGRASVVLTVLVCALVVELVALVPAFQLKYLRTRAGRAAFSTSP